MKNRILLFASVSALSLCGCAGPSSSSSSALKALTDPNNLAIAAQDATTTVVSLVLFRNPKYEAAFIAVADAMSATASSNPAQLSTADVIQLLAVSGLSANDQEEVAVGVIAAQGVFLSAFKDVELPTLKPIYQLFLYAAANGIYLATGHPSIPLPVIPAASSPPAAPSS